jgi:hypothetical protein
MVKLGLAVKLNSRSVPTLADHHSSPTAVDQARRLNVRFRRCSDRHETVS